MLLFTVLAISKYTQIFQKQWKLSSNYKITRILLIQFKHYKMKMKIIIVYLTT